jgi:predicted CXXCH cytochrome family protein
MRSGDVGGDPKIINPAKLAPPNRASVCAQCHLTGEARVYRPDATWQTYRPGDRLSDSQTAFVRAAKTAGITVTGHVENLALSACKRQSGDRLWCGSCHDPHVVPSPSQASAFYRSRCLTCHTTESCTETPAARAAAHDDCISCHMRKSSASDAQHVVLTDHSIPRRPRIRSVAAGDLSHSELVPFDGSKPSTRDLALAYAIAAIGKTTGPDRERATALLEASVRQNPDDSETLLYLAEIYRTGRKNELAIPLYRRAIQLDPTQATGSVGLGGVLMERGDLSGSIPLFRDALSKNAGLQLVRMNLAVALWQTGDRAGAESILREGIALNPAYAPARELLARISKAP